MEIKELTYLSDHIKKLDPPDKLGQKVLIVITLVGGNHIHYEGVTHKF